VVSAEKAGAPVPDVTREIRLTLEGDAVTFALAGEVRKGTYTLDPTKQPRAIDFTVLGKTARGIYRLDKGKLEICFAEAGLPRPREFKAGGERELLAVLMRAPGSAAGGKETSKEEVERLRRELAEARIELARLRAKRAAANARAAESTAQGAAQMAANANNLKQIGLAMHNYESAVRTFPAAAISSKDGKPLLSWRVALLPYLDEKLLYNQFKLDEPWDSPHNKKLLAKMPKVYMPLGVDTKMHSTIFRVFVGPGAAFEGTKGMRVASFTDGTSNTILVVEAGEAVPWTKPDELSFTPKGKLPKVGGHFKNGFNVLMGDGSVRRIRANFDPELLRAAITRNGGEVLDFDKLAD